MPLTFLTMGTRSDIQHLMNHRKQTVELVIIIIKLEDILGKRLELFFHYVRNTYKQNK